RLSHRAEPRHVHRRRRHPLEPPRRHALRCARPAGPLWELIGLVPTRTSSSIRSAVCSTLVCAMAVSPLGVDATTALPPRPRPASAWAALARFCRKKPLGAAGGAIMLVILLTAVFADQLQTYDPIATDAAQSLAPPSREHWLGSDH